MSEQTHNGMQPGDPCEVEWPKGWQSGWTYQGRVTALDRDYRVCVERDRDGFRVIEAAPECVRCPRTPVAPGKMSGSRAAHAKSAQLINGR